MTNEETLHAEFISASRPQSSENFSWLNSYKILLVFDPEGTCIQVIFPEKPLKSPPVFSRGLCGVSYVSFVGNKEIRQI